MSIRVPYNENLLAHQEPVRAVSEWQEFNEMDGRLSIASEMDLARTMKMVGADLWPFVDQQRAILPRE